MAKFSGVTTFHLKRAINHGPNSKRDNSCIDFDSASKSNKRASTGNPTWRRLFGEINLTGIETPDVNKSQFNWSYNGYQDLTDELKVIWDNLNDLINVIVNWEKFKISTVFAEESSKNKKQLYENSLKVYNPSKIKVDLINESDSNEKICFTLKEQNAKLWIDEGNDKEMEFIQINEGQVDNEGQKNIHVKFNVDHPFWKPFMDNEDEKIQLRSNLTYPIILLLVISYLCINEKEFKSFFLNDDNPNSDNPKEFTNVINSVVRAMERRKDEQ